MDIIFGSFWEIKYVLKYFVYYLECSPLQATVETLMCGSNRYLQEIKRWSLVAGKRSENITGKWATKKNLLLSIILVG